MSPPDPFPTVPFEGVYLVTDELKLATHEEVDALERELGFRMPHGYREYVTTLGEGEYCDILRVKVPRRIRRRPRRGPEEVYWWVDRLPLGFTEDTATELVEFADTSNGDRYFIHRSEPQQVICLPRNVAARGVEVDARAIRLEDLYWHTVDKKLEDPPGFRTFDAYTPYNYYSLGELPVTAGELADVVDRAFDGCHVEWENRCRSGRGIHCYVKAFGGRIIAGGASGFIDFGTLIDRSTDPAVMARWWDELAHCGFDRPVPFPVKCGS